MVYPPAAQLDRKLKRVDKKEIDEESISAAAPFTCYWEGDIDFTQLNRAVSCHLTFCQHDEGSPSIVRFLRSEPCLKQREKPKLVDPPARSPPGGIRQQ